MKRVLERNDDGPVVQLGANRLKALALRFLRLIASIAKLTD
ncbi:MAG: hypothetical protein PHQ96_09670 [Candidatus Omnitrophica bacterium]|nr:hypothetical protein [Candidatus Omnitrophota bacterium]MDD5584447.1 hypothetical protein [Candidatus Omnitrophota bacterium]